jgi:hypothetical protein
MTLTPRANEICHTMPALTSAKNVALLLIVLLCAGSMCWYWSRITINVHASRATSSVLKPKVLTDFYPSWYATRELLLRHEDPYGTQVNRNLEVAYYGKELDPLRPEERQDQQRFVYPAYFIFFVIPLARLDFATARIIFWWVLLACAAANAFLWLLFCRLRFSSLELVIFFALVLSSIPVIQNLSILQPFLLPACFLAGGAVALVSGRLFLAGMLFAVTTVKPQICVLPLAWLALWLGSNWAHRKHLLGGFVSSMGVLLLASHWLVPSWLFRYPAVLHDYAEYTRTTSFLSVFLPPPLNWLAALLALAVVAEFCWRARHEPADSVRFAVALSFSLSLTTLVIPAVVQPFNHVLLIPVVLLAIRYWHELMRGTSLTRTAARLFCFCAFLPWMLAIIAVSRPLTPHSDWLLRIWSVPLAASMALPFAAFGVLILLRKLPRQNAAIIG